jgi:GTPase
MKLPYVLVVGRPNVGKSSLFNAFTGKKIAIVDESANTTRDILEYPMADFETGFHWTIADSGGLNFGSQHQILQDVNKRVNECAEQADLILMVVEYDRLTDVDDHIITMLRKLGKPVWIVANKADNAPRYNEAFQHLSTGFPVYPVSASHRKVDELETAIVEFLINKYPEHAGAPQDEGIKIALVGRPNVGKSSTFNALVGYDKVVVSEEAGTTRDSTDTPLMYKGEKMTLIDTAGFRKPGKIGVYNVESWSVLRTKAAVERADVCVLLVDSVEGIVQQDKHILAEVLEQKKGVIIMVNKWDLSQAKTDMEPDMFHQRYMAYLQREFAYCPWAMTVFATASEGKGVKEILDHAIGIYQERLKRVSTGEFNRFLERTILEHAPRGGRKVHNPKVYYGSQVAINPPKFIINVNKSDSLHFSWKRFLENRIRQEFGFHGTPIEVDYHGKDPDKNPYKPVKSMRPIGKKKEKKAAKE